MTGGADGHLLTMMLIKTKKKAALHVGPILCHLMIAVPTNNLAMKSNLAVPGSSNLGPSLPTSTAPTKA